MNTPVDLRVNPIDTISTSRTISNIAGSASVSIDATPVMLEVVTYEEEQQLIRCSYESATLPYIAERPTGCNFQFFYSSVGQDGDPIAVKSVLTWQVTALGDTVVANPISATTEWITVAELQSIVTADG